jgi:hypothetical protein
MRTSDPAAVSRGRPVAPARATPLGRLASLLRGDKYMVNAYPPQWRDPVSSAPVATPDAQER